MAWSDVPQWILAVGGFAGITGGAVTVFQSRAARRRLDAEAEKLDADAEYVLTQRAGAVNAMALGLLEPMERRIGELTTEAEVLRDQVRRLTDQVNALTDRLVLAQDLLSNHGIALPPWPNRRNEVT